MTPEIADAIESARSTISVARAFRPMRLMSFERVRAIVLSVLRDVPEGMTVAELREELDR